jgi:hypothetical protein
MEINGNLPEQITPTPSTTAYFNNFFNQPVSTSPMINDAVVAFFQKITGNKDTGTNLAASVIYTCLQQSIDPMSVIDQLKALNDKSKINSPQEYYSHETNQYAQDEYVFVPGQRGTISNCTTANGNAIVSSTSSVSTVRVGATVTGNGIYTGGRVTVLEVSTQNKTLKLSGNSSANVANTTLSYTNPDTWGPGPTQYAKPGPSTPYANVTELDAYLVMLLNLNRAGTSLLGISNSPQTSPYVKRMILA